MIDLYWLFQLQPEGPGVLHPKLRKNKEVAVVISHSESLNQCWNYLVNFFFGDVFVNFHQKFLFLLGRDRWSSELIQILESFFIFLKNLNFRLVKLFFFYGFFEFRYCRLQNFFRQLDENTKAFLRDFDALKVRRDVQ